MGMAVFASPDSLSAPEALRVPHRLWYPLVIVFCSSSDSPFFFSSRLRLLRIHVAVNGCSRNTKHLTDFGDRVLPAVIKLSEHLNFLVVESSRPAAFFSSGPRCLKACLGSLMNDIPFKLGQRTKDMKNEFSG